MLRSLSFAISNSLSLCRHPDPRHHRRDHDPITSKVHHDFHGGADFVGIARVRTTVRRGPVGEGPVDVGRRGAVAVVHGAHEARVDGGRPGAVGDDLVQEGAVVGRVAPADLVPLAHAGDVARGVAPVVVVVVGDAVRVRPHGPVQPEARGEQGEGAEGERVRGDASRG